MIFQDFVDRKHRKAIRELKILEQIVKMGGFETKGFFEDKFDPYVFVKSNTETPFEGIRLYKIGDHIAYRVQNEVDSHPYGSAFDLNVEAMFDDYVEDGEHKHLGEKVAKSVVEDLKHFFKINAQMSRDMLKDGMAQDPFKQPQTNSLVLKATSGFRADGTFSF